MCVRERDRVYVRVKLREKDRVCVHVCVREEEKEREIQKDRARKGETESLFVSRFYISAVSIVY